MVGTIIYEVGTIICNIGTINVRFYLLEIRYPHGYCRITHTKIMFGISTSVPFLRYCKILASLVALCCVVYFENTFFLIFTNKKSNSSFSFLLLLKITLTKRCMEHSHGSPLDLIETFPFALSYLI